MEKAKEYRDKIKKNGSVKKDRRRMIKSKSISSKPEIIKMSGKNPVCL